MKDILIRFAFLIALGAIAALVLVDQRFWNGVGLSNALHSTRKDVFATLASIFGALLGFVITAYSIVASLNDTVVLKRLRAMNGQDKVFGVFIQAIYVIGASVVVSLTAIFLDSSEHSDKSWVEYTVAFFAFWASISVLSVMFVIEKLLLAAGVLEDSKGGGQASGGGTTISAP